jgi:hypothetical protein
LLLLLPPLCSLGSPEVSLVHAGTAPAEDTAEEDTEPGSQRHVITNLTSWIHSTAHADDLQAALHMAQTMW